MGQRSAERHLKGNPKAGRVKMNKTYVALLEQASDGGWGAYVPDLPGCFSWGESRADAARNVRDAIETYMDALREFNEPIPEPRSFAESISIP
jgi:predicted RNase H-like HicB family nuclease